MRHKNTLVLGGIVAAFLAIIFFTLTSIKGTNAKPISSSAGEQMETLKEEGTSIAIIKKLDTETGTLTATDVDSKMESIYSFTGGTKFTSRYGQELIAKDLPLGEIVELTYDKDTNRILTCVVTDVAWEYTGVSNWSIDKENESISIGSKTFSYGTLFQVFNNKQMIDSNALNEKDKITVKGMNGQAYSIIVTKGHGTFQLANYSDFMGGSIEIGYDVMTKVEEDQIITLREGDYRVTVKKGSLEAVKYVHIRADELTTLDLSDSKLTAAKKAKVTFTIMPNGATLFINNVETDYTKEIELEHGTYAVKAICKGYEDYEEQLIVEEGTEKIQINLVSSSLSKATASPSPSPSATEAPSVTESPTATATPSASASPTASAVASPSPTATAVSVVRDPDHTITVNGPSDVKLYVNGDYKGTLPVTFTKVVGTNIPCTLKKEGQSDKTYSMTVTDEKQNVTWQFSQWW